MPVFGGVVGLGLYGAAKMLDRGSKESYAQVFARMEDKISWREAYIQELLELELEAFLREDKLKREFLLLEAGSEISKIKEELERRKLFLQNSDLFPTDDSTPSPSDSEGAWIKSIPSNITRAWSIRSRLVLMVKRLSVVVTIEPLCFGI
ncbi:MAG: hypothetical protein ACUVQO_06435 [Leptodesmis sp.]